MSKKLISMILITTLALGTTMCACGETTKSNVGKSSEVESKSKKEPQGETYNGVRINNSKGCYQATADLAVKVSNFLGETMDDTSGGLTGIYRNIGAYGEGLDGQADSMKEVGAPRDIIDDFNILLGHIHKMAETSKSMEKAGTVSQRDVDIITDAVTGSLQSSHSLVKTCAAHGIMPTVKLREKTKKH